MQTSEREDYDVSLEFDDEELLFEDEPLPDDAIAFREVSDAKPVSRQESDIGVLVFAREEAQSRPLQTILWPVYGWRIAAPQTTTRKLDFLLLTSLRLARAGVTRHQEQAKLLGLHKDLVYSLMQQLFSQDYMDLHGRMTDKGEQILNQEGEEEEQRTDYGWIFQDATAGELLPFFCTESLRFAAPCRSDITQAFQLPWIRQTLPPPDASDVTSAIETQRRLLKRVQAAESTNEQDTAPLAVCEFTQISEEDSLVSKNTRGAKQPENFRVRLLNQRPQRFYLLVSCIIEATHDGQFSLGCPFGLPDGFRWVRLLNFAASQCEEGKRLVEHLQSKSHEIWKHQQPSDLEPVSVTRQVSDKVTFEVGSPPTNLWKRVWEELERMEQSRLLLERGFDEVDTTITRSQRVLEQLMLTLLRLDSIPPNIWEHYKRGDALKQCLRDTVQACGGSEIPERILCAKLGAVRHVLDGGKESLRPYIATFLLSASRRSSLHRSLLEHLLRELPSFLSDVEQIAHIRNKFGAHAGGSHNEPIILVEDLVITIYQLVRSVVQALRLTSR